MIKRNLLITKKRLPVSEIILFGFWPSIMKVLLYKLRGYKLGKNVHIGFGSIITGKNVQVGTNTKIGMFSFIMSGDVNIGRFVQIGSFSYIDVSKLIINDDSRINEHVYVSGLSLPDSELNMGKRTLIMQYSFLNPTKPIIIEDDVALGGLCCVFTHSSWQSVMDGYPVRFAPVTIRKNVWIAWRVFILPGVEIGENSTIAADTTVTTNIPPHSLASGSPVKINLTGEKYWPRKISDKAKTDVLKNINEEFAAYLNSNGFGAEIIEKNGYIKINVRNQPGSIYIYDRNLSLEELSRDDVIISLFGKSILQTDVMQLNIEMKNRKGSNRLGEEYVRFLSRYGIRFNRLD